MRFLKAITTDEKTELFNVDNILTIQPSGEKTKILMGAGLWYWVYTDSIALVDCYNELLQAIKEV